MKEFITKYTLNSKQGKGECPQCGDKNHSHTTETKKQEKSFMRVLVVATMKTLAGITRSPKISSLKILR